MGYAFEVLSPFISKLTQTKLSVNLIQVLWNAGEKPVRRTGSLPETHRGDRKPERNTKVFR
jgi:hypothetical protein